MHPTYICSLCTYITFRFYKHYSAIHHILLICSIQFNIFNGDVFERRQHRRVFCDWFQRAGMTQIVKTQRVFLLAQRSSCVNEWYDLCRITSRKQRSAAQLVKACWSAARSSAAQLQIVATSCTSMKKAQRSAARKSAAQRRAAQLQLAATSCN